MNFESRDLALSKMADDCSRTESQLLGKFVEKQTKYGTATRLVAKSSLLVKHRVSQSDTLMGIALKYGSSVEQIKRENKLWTNDSLFMREHLLIPITNEFASDLPKNCEVIEVDNTLRSRSSSSSSGLNSNNPITESESENTDSMKIEKNKSEKELDTSGQDFLSKFDNSFAVLKSNVKKMEQNTSFSDDLHNPLMCAPQTNAASSHHSLSFSCNGSPGQSESPVLRIKSRTHKLQSSVTSRLEQTNDELFQL